MGKFTINVDEGMDVASYHTDEAPGYLFQPVPSPVEGEPDGRLVFCTFVPKNGHARGKLTFVPYPRVISVTQDIPEQDEETTDIDRKRP